MAVVTKKDNVWTNNDGLNVLFHKSQGQVIRGGSYREAGSGRHCTEVIIDLADLPTAASGDEQIQSETLIIPSGVYIEQVDVFVEEEPTTSGSPNLDLGLVKLTRLEYDFNGLLAAADAFETGTDVGTTHTYLKGTTEAGALVGAVTAFAGYVSASADTADWTDGTLRVRIYYHVPLTADL